jgi:hypothetical protein
MSFEEDPMERESLIPTNDPTSDGGFGATPKGSPKLWARTIMVGIVYYGLGAVGSAAIFWYFGLWFGALAALGLTIVLPWTTRVACSCLYKASASPKRWKKTVSSIVFWSVFFGAFSTVAAGYFYREFDSAYIQHKYYAGVDASTSTFPADLGVVGNFKGGAKANPELGGRAAAWGFWPVCVTPILSDKTETNVHVFAIGAGMCCTKQPMSCESWGSVDPLGGVVVRHQELYPVLQAAVADAKSTFALNSDPSPLFIRYGDIETLKASYRFRYSIIAGATGAFAFLVMVIKSLRGKY